MSPDRRPHQDAAGGGASNLWWWLALAFIGFLFVQSLTSGHRETLPYSEFKELVRAGKVAGVVVEQDTSAGARVSPSTTWRGSTRRGPS